MVISLKPCIEGVEIIGEGLISSTSHTDRFGVSHRVNWCHGLNPQPARLKVTLFEFLFSFVIIGYFNLSDGLLHLTVHSNIDPVKNSHSFVFRTVLRSFVTHGVLLGKMVIVLVGMILSTEKDMLAHPLFYRLSALCTADLYAGERRAEL